MKHLNRVVKDHVSNLGTNVAEKSILQCGQSLKGLMEACSNFDEQVNLHKSSTSHTKANASSDERIIIEELTGTSRVFDYIPGRVHPTFKTLHHP